MLVSGSLKGTGTHPALKCKIFGDIASEERDRIILDNARCPFCRLHGKEDTFFGRGPTGDPHAEGLSAKKSISRGYVTS
jgi:hypothetical protein